MGKKIISKKRWIETLEVWKKNNPNPTSDLISTNNFTFTVAVLLSAQSTDEGVNKATKELFKIADTPEKMLSLGIDNLKNHIKTIGLYNNKAKNIILLSEKLIKDHNSKIPNTPEKLEALPGLGRKSANVIANHLFKTPTIGVDTHIIRLSHRLNIIDDSAGKNTLKIEKELLKRTPKEYLTNVGNWIVLHGRYICKAKKTLCEKCPIYDLCTSNEKI
ncbi:MAG: endonuclease III [Alphaproteobacteria bacterium]|jgi:endonuclease-3|nr:endonuclease III [Alphaproteobacteria bacterium]